MGEGRNRRERFLMGFKFIVTGDTEIDGRKLAEKIVMEVFKSMERFFEEGDAKVFRIHGPKEHRLGRFFRAVFLSPETAWVFHKAFKMWLGKSIPGDENSKLVFCGYEEFLDFSRYEEGVSYELTFRFRTEEKEVDILREIVNSAKFIKRIFGRDVSLVGIEAMRVLWFKRTRDGMTGSFRVKCSKSSCLATDFLRFSEFGGRGEVDLLKISENDHVPRL